MPSAPTCRRKLTVGNCSWNDLSTAVRTGEGSETSTATATSELEPLLQSLDPRAQALQDRNHAPRILEHGCSRLL